jgi:hypothetical protein
MINSIIINSMILSIHIPIIEDIHYESKRIDPRIFIIQMIIIHSYNEIWIPIRFKVEVENHLFIIPIRYSYKIKGIYTSYSYLIISKKMNHLFIINLNKRLMRIDIE